jgi:hypothetical protein
MGDVHYKNSDDDNNGRVITKPADHAARYQLLLTCYRYRPADVSFKIRAAK